MKREAFNQPPFDRASGRISVGGDRKTMAQLAAQVGVGGSYFSSILRLSFLSPDRQNHTS
jgi:hypothetical protein